MKITNAIAYLRDTSKPAATRFKVLTGYDTQSGVKDKGLDFWFNNLVESMVIETIEKANASASVGSFFTASFSFVTGNTMLNQLKTAFKSACTTTGDEQVKAQESYITMVADYLDKHKTEQGLVDFIFADPKILENKEVEAALYAV